jgi:1,4-dihydroxy-2-naphthoate octaprenyltransferase
VANPKQQRIDPKTVSAAVARGKSKRPGGRPPGVAKVKKATAKDWIAGARLRTLPLGIAPVVLGTATAWIINDGDSQWKLAILCLVVALALQIAVNYANDYSDGIRGTDAHRVGPSRLTGSGAAAPRAVLTVALVFFGIAAAAGIAITVLTGYYWLLAVGTVCIVAAWFYTGGKRPYGYNALGEVFVFIFFGIVATAGTTFVQAGTVNFETWIAAVAIGLIACAVLIVNNLRDLEQDKLAGKRTLSVLIGATVSRVLFGLFLLVPFVLLLAFVFLYYNAGYTYLALLIAVPAVIITATAKTPGEYILALKLASLTALAYSVILAVTIIVPF